MFVGTPDGLEARLVPEADIAYHSLPSRGFDRSRPWTLLSAAAVAISSVVKAWALLGRVRPDVVLGFGGYVSLPVGLAAVARGIPLVLHEQNSVPGLANRVLSRWARAVGVTYEESISALAHPEHAVVTGNPVRESVLGSSRREGRLRLGLADDDLVVLAFGGSRGARHLNSALVALRGAILADPRVRVVHVTGRNEFEAVQGALGSEGRDAGRWMVLDYLEGMGDAIAAADVVVARAGATSIAEITALGAVSLLVPYPYATEDHQTKNAATLVAHGAAVLVSDAELDTPRFADELLGLLSDPDRRATMSAASRALSLPDAAARVEHLARDAAPIRNLRS